MKTFDEFMREGGIFVEILSFIPVWQVIRHAPGEIFETPGSCLDGVGVVIDQSDCSVRSAALRPSCAPRAACCRFAKLVCLDFILKKKSIRNACLFWCVLPHSLIRKV